ncbi:MAG: hypothetical protein ABWY27_18505 [Telluria sp.]
MSGAADHRAAEVAAKLALARGWLDDSGAAALRRRGVRLQDTFLMGQHGLENLTRDPAWLAVQGHSRPLWLEAAC